MIWWDQEIIIEEESHEKMNNQEEHHINDNTPSLVASPAFIFPDTVLALLSKVIIKYQIIPFNQVKT